MIKSKSISEISDRIKPKSPHDQLVKKAEIVYNEWKIYYESGISFIGMDYFQTHDDYKDLINCWGKETIENCHKLIIEHESEFYF